MKDLFLNIIKVIFGICFVCFGFTSVMYIIWNIGDGKVTEDFFVTFPVAGLFLCLTILTHYLDKIFIEKEKNISCRFAIVNLILSIVFFSVGAFGNFRVREFEVLRLLNALNAILLGIIFSNIGLIKICKTKE